MGYLQVLTCLAIVLCVGIAADYDDRYYRCGRFGVSPYPYIVSLAHRRHNNEHIHACGGTLITRSDILTAASCFDNKLDLTKWQVRAGTLCATYGGQLRTIVNVTMHPQTEEGVLSDLAIVRMSVPLNYDINARPAKLPNKTVDPLTLDTPTIIGWGEDETGVPTEQLNYGHVTLVDAKSCAIRMKKTWGLRSGVICTAEHNGTIPTPCRGDVGGPLLANEDVVLGVISRIPAKCAAIGTDDGYVDVATYRDWIASVAGLD